jgi:hypothetical protein
MPKKISNTTKAHLISVPLPQHGASYTVISHQFVMDYATQQLANAGFNIVDEEYRCTADGQIAQGIYRLQFNSDPDLSMMFAWTNSYNKQVKFKCVVGAYIKNTGSVMICGDIGNWVRKHTGTADTETKDTIDDYITNAHMYYNQLVSDKAAMEKIDLNRRKQSQLLGVLFAEYEILTTEQASLVRDQIKKPLHVFASSDSLWAFYNYVTVALQKSHPRTWMEDQRILHYFISTIANFQQTNATPVAAAVVPVVEDNTNEDTEEFIDPNQTNILDQIAETESTEADLDSLESESSEPEEDDQPEQEVLTNDEIVDNLYLNSDDDATEEPAESGEEQVLYIDEDGTEVIDEVEATEAEVESLEDPHGDEDHVDGVDEIPETDNTPTTVEDEFAEEDNFDLDFSEDANEDQDNVPDFF